MRKLLIPRFAALSGALFMFIAGCSSGGGADAGSCYPDGGCPVCGNGVREPGEQCDDGNTGNLDGCDSQCRLEVEERATSLKLQTKTDATCPDNALGGALVLAATQSSVQSAIDAEVADGGVNTLFKFIGLTEPTGAGNQSIQLGALSGSPYAAAAGGSYSGSSDLDWWYADDGQNLDAEKNPTALLPATLAGGALRASGDLKLGVPLGNGPVQMSLTGVTLAATVGTPTKPTVSTGNTPGHLSSENLDPALTAIGSLTGGELCGNVSAASLASSPVPAALTSAHCSESYSTSSTLLDLFVSGCTAYGLVSALAPTQPDQVDPTAAAAGAGAPYTLSASSGTRVDTCKDKSGTQVALQTCLASAAYSIFFQFTADRVIVK